MNLSALVAELESRGATFASDGDRVRFTAPAGVLNHPVRTILSRQKPELAALLKGDGFSAAGALLVSHIGTVSDAELWHLDRHYTATASEWVDMGLTWTDAEWLAYTDLAESLEGGGA